MKSKVAFERTFASDNNSGVHPKIMRALEAANHGHVPAYGADALTERAIARFRELLGEKSEVFFVFNGTAANVLCLSALARPHHGVICAAKAHISEDECGAPERFTGCKLILVPPEEAPGGKLTPQAVQKKLQGFGDQQHVQPRVISIAQTTEYGTVYAPAEIQALAELAHRNGMYLHMDGARIANAAAALGLSLRELAADCGVDALSFGGTKNGLLCGEAAVFFDPALAHDFKYVRKQGMQLSSKMRFIAAQFLALFEGDLWRGNAAHANAMAKRLSEGASALGIPLTQKTQANAVFAALPKDAIAALQSECLFYVWDESHSASHAEVRWVASFDTTPEDVDRFLALLKSRLT